MDHLEQKNNSQKSTLKINKFIDTYWNEKLLQVATIIDKNVNIKKVAKIGVEEGKLSNKKTYHLIETNIKHKIQEPTLYTTNLKELANIEKLLTKKSFLLLNLIKYEIANKKGMDLDGKHIKDIYKESNTIRLDYKYYLHLNNIIYGETVTPLTKPNLSTAIKELKDLNVLLEDKDDSKCIYRFNPLIFSSYNRISMLRKELKRQGLLIENKNEKDRETLINIMFEDMNNNNITLEEYQTFKKTLNKNNECEYEKL